jgi:LmbE family N-acetylglucosaminyl deacetylase
MQPELPELAPKIILAVAAHPDDLEFGASGSVAKWIREGAKVHYLICTDASKGTSDTSISPAQLIKTRRDEQRAAAAILGVSSVTFLDYEDGLTEATKELKRDIAREIRRRRPDTVVALDPKLLYDENIGYINHSDHRNVGLATMDAIYPLARDHLSFPELLEEGFPPHNVAEILFTGGFNHNYLIDITATYEIKLAALAAHASQIDMTEPPVWLDQMSRALGAEAGYERAEAFIRLRLFA